MIEYKNLNEQLNYTTARTVSKSNRKILGTDAKLILITHIYMTDHFDGLEQKFQ